MTSRERTITALKHREPDRVPVTLAYETPEGIAGRYGHEPYAKHMRQDIYAVTMDPAQPMESVRQRYLPDVPEHAVIDGWGVARWYSSTGSSHAVVGPLRDMTTTAELERFEFPDQGHEQYASHLEADVRKLHNRGVAVQGAMSQTIFELAWAMYGMENLMIGFHEHPDFVELLFDRITERRIAMAEHYARAGVDLLRLGDDIGTQRGMMIDPEVWRRFLKPRFASIIAAARAIRPDIQVFYHSDGNIEPVIEELIEIGVTILNPIQPECMDPFTIKRRFGDRLTLWGTIGTQTVFPFGTPETVRETVRRLIGELAPGGGYVIGPTHSIEQDVRWENIVAFYEAVEEFGSY